MARYSHGRLGTGATCVTALLALAGCSRPIAQRPASVVAPGSAANAPIVIAVLADRFTSAERADFDDAVANFFRYGLLTNPVYKAYAHDISIVPIFQAWSSTQTPDSNYGFRVVAGGIGCNITSTRNTSALIEAALGKKVDALRTVIIGNYGYTSGCAYGEWAYVAAGAVGKKVLDHELGHVLAGLYDEYSLPSQAQQHHPSPLECRNCSTNVSDPHWDYGDWGCDDEPYDGYPGCNLYGLGIIHPTARCIMGAHGHQFCCVCQRGLRNAFAHFEQPHLVSPDIGCPSTEITDPTKSHLLIPGLTAPSGIQFASASVLLARQPEKPAPRLPEPLVRVLVTLSRDRATAPTVRSVHDSFGVFTPAHRRLGSYVYEVSDGGATITTGVLTGDPFVERDYRSGSPRHEVTRTRSVDIVVRIPGETVARLRGRPVRITFYQLTSGVTFPLITPAVLETLTTEKQAVPIGTISSEELNKMM